MANNIFKFLYIFLGIESFLKFSNKNYKKWIYAISQVLGTIILANIISFTVCYLSAPDWMDQMQTLINSGNMIDMLVCFGFLTCLGIGIPAYVIIFLMLIVLVIVVIIYVVLGLIQLPSVIKKRFIKSLKQSRGDQ